MTLTCSDLTFGYDPSTTILESFSHSFDQGSMTALTGPSGRGKSTLLYLLGLMLRPTSGTVAVDGHPVQNADDRVMSRLRALQYGFVFQDAALDSSRTVIDNVTEAAVYRGERRRLAETYARHLLDVVGVSLRADARPLQVSGGQAQRIALCRALLHRPAIVLADEPTGNLDNDSRDVVLQVLRDHASTERATVVIVTHDLHVASECDQVIAL